MHPPGVRWGSEYAHQYSQRRHRKHPAFPTQWFYSLYVISRGPGFFCPRHLADHDPRNLTPASGCQDHTTSPSASAPFVIGASASTASRPANVTIAYRPCWNGTGKSIILLLPCRQVKFLVIGNGRCDPEQRIEAGEMRVPECGPVAVHDGTATGRSIILNDRVGVI